MSQEPPPPVSTGTLLLHAFQGFQRLLFDGYRARGQVDLRPKHGAVIANLDAEGTRPSVLAARAGITKPAMGELIDEMEAIGYVRRVPDPSDRRAKLVVPTDRALARQVVARELMTEIEAVYLDHLGPSAYLSLRRRLTELIALTGSGSEVAQPPA
jgi:DNA-binding MarR family transcriptional regulator